MFKLLIFRNWEGLVEAVGYTYELIRLLRNRDSPTAAFLEAWEIDDSNPTFANLLEYLQIIERFDVISDVLPYLGE